MATDRTGLWSPRRRTLWPSAARPFRRGFNRQPMCGLRSDMGTWGADTFQNDAALDFINTELDRHVSAIEELFRDESRFHLDEDAEGELMPRIEILLALCDRCHGVLQEDIDIAAWKARYLVMYDEQIDGMEPGDDLKQQRRAVIADTFDQLIQRHAAQWRHTP